MTKINSLAVSTLAAVTTVLFTAHSAVARDQIRIVGSSTVFPFTTTVAEQFGKQGKFPTPIVESTGTGGGFKLFCSGVGEEFPDITGASRAIKKSEFEACQKAGVNDLIEVKVGYDGIVMAHAKASQGFNVTRKQLWQALAKDTVQGDKIVPNPYKSWSEIDPSFPNVAISVYGPPPTSGTRDAFVELVMDKGCEEFAPVKALEKDKVKGVCQSLREDGAYIDAGENDNLIVQKLVADPQAFGIFGYSFLEENTDKLQGNGIEGTVPTYEAIASGDYKISRPLFIYVKKAHIGVIPGVQEFLAEYSTDKAWGPEGYLTSKGLIAMPDEERKGMATRVSALTVMSPPEK
jgi:phosphate transport system substrate-binding protein